MLFISILLSLGLISEIFKKQSDPVKITAPNYQQILPILITRCAACHNPGTPKMNWLDYEIAFKNREKIKFRLETRTMPPAGYILLDEEREKLINWTKNE